MSEESLKPATPLKDMLEKLPKTTNDVITALEVPPTEPAPTKSEDKKDVGRPTVFTPQTIDKLEQVFALGGTDLEACFFAGIGKTALYNYQNEHPEFVERKEALKEKPFLKARQTIIAALDKPEHAQWYMERKKKKEFALRIENTGAEGKDLIPLTPEQEKSLDLLLIGRQNNEVQSNPQ